MGKVRDQKNRRGMVAYKAKVKAEEAKEVEKKQTVKQAFERRRLLVQVRQEAAEFATGLKRGQDPADAIQQVLDNMMSAYEYATQQMMELPVNEYFVPTLGGMRLHHWIVEQERLGLQLTHIASKAAALGLAERTVRVHEAQAALFAQVVEKVLTAAGMPLEERRVLHAAIAEEMMTIEGSAREIVAA